MTRHDLVGRGRRPIGNIDATDAALLPQRIDLAPTSPQPRFDLAGRSRDLVRRTQNDFVQLVRGYVVARTKTTSKCQISTSGTTHHPGPLDSVAAALAGATTPEAGQ
jgi:hypothetical protein